VGCLVCDCRFDDEFDENLLVIGISGNGTISCNVSKKVSEFFASREIPNSFVCKCENFKSLFAPINGSITAWKDGCLRRYCFLLEDLFENLRSDINKVGSIDQYDIDCLKKSLNKNAICDRIGSDNWNFVYEFFMNILRARIKNEVDLYKFFCVGADAKEMAVFLEIYGMVSSGRPPSKTSQRNIISSLINALSKSFMRKGMPNSFNVDSLISFFIKKKNVNITQQKNYEIFAGVVF